MSSAMFIFFINILSTVIHSNRHSEASIWHFLIVHCRTHSCHMHHFWSKPKLNCQVFINADLNKKKSVGCMSWVFRVEIQQMEVEVNWEEEKSMDSLDVEEEQQRWRRSAPEASKEAGEQGRVVLHVEGAQTTWGENMGTDTRHTRSVPIVECQVESSEDSTMLTVLLFPILYFGHEQRISPKWVIRFVQRSGLQPCDILNHKAVFWL